MNYFCTLFDSNYLSRGLALLESLEENSDNFHLFIFAFDSNCLKILRSLKNKNISIISLEEFEDESLLRVKPTRSKAEYCWTCTPAIISYCMKNFSIKECTYVDADIYFFSNPQILLDEIAEKHSALITEHRYTPEYDQTKTSGKYCVQFMTFKNTPDSLSILEWWKAKCIEWCFSRFEDGKFGDQKYLDDWPQRFPTTHELSHLGGGMAPWNIQQYDLFVENNKLFAKKKDNALAFPVVFYHFHAVRFLTEKTIDFGEYKLEKDILTNIYRPYCLHLEKIQQKIQPIENIDIHGQNLSKKSFPQKIVFFLRSLLGKHRNIFSLEKMRVDKWPI